MGNTTTSSSGELIFPPVRRQQLCYSSLYGGGGREEGASSQCPPDPHLMCLKLGKRQYYFDDNATHISQTPEVSNSMGKRGKPSAGFPPRCQVEGCNARLVDAKDYHRRHKVCEMHSKAPVVTVLGLEQRFCQQCSRFHVVSEFDDTRRSCRRKLAGHNERRRKGSNESVSRNYSRAKSNKWDSPSDLSSRSSAALRELIAEHRAATLSRQLFFQNLCNHHTFQELDDKYQPAAGGSSSLIPPASDV